MTTYKGLPGPHICDFWTREASAANYDDGSSFQIGRIDMVANTGTYLDAPFHRYADGADLAELQLASLADLPGHRRPAAVGEWARDRRRSISTGWTSRGKAVLVHTGWDRHWRTDAYFGEHPFLTAEAARLAGRAWRGAGRDRQPQYRRHARPRAAGAHALLGAGHPDLRAYDRARQPARRGLPLLRGAAQGRRAWAPSRCAPTPCSAERARFSQSGMIASVGMASTRAMVDRQAELRIGDARARSPPSPSTTTSRRLTFCRQFIRAVFSWPTKQPLEKLTPFSSAALHSSQRMSPSSARPSHDAEAQAMLEPAARGLAGRAEPAPAERGRRGSGTPSSPSVDQWTASDGIALDRDRPAQAIDRQPLDQVVGGLGLAIEQQIVAIGPDDEIEQAFALRRQQPGPDRQRARRHRWSPAPGGSRARPRRTGGRRRGRSRVVAAMPLS